MLEGSLTLSNLIKDPNAADEKANAVVPVGVKIRTGSISETFRVARKRDREAILALRKKPA